MPDTATVTPEAGKPVFTPNEPTSLTPKVTGEVHDQPVKTNAERIAATVAAKAATPAGTAAATAPAVAAPGTGPGAGAALDDAAIAAASAKATELAETKTAVVTEPETFEQRAAKAAELFKTDPLKAMEVLGMPLDKVIKQATGGDPSEPTEADKLRAELEKERADRAADNAKSLAATAQAQAEANKQATVAAIIADPAYPNVNSPDKVAAAFKYAQSAYKILVTDLGRDLNETEKDKLVAYHLKKQDQKLASAVPAELNPLPKGSVTSTVKTNVVAAPAGTKRSWQQIKADLKAGAAKRSN
jgi:hypothetical protein